MKDPAFLFYSSDFLTGTMTMSNEQVGKYIRLLCLQHQKGVLSELDMNFICGTYDKQIFDKFEKTDEGYYNKRLKFEAEKRANFCKSRSENRDGKGKTKQKKIRKSYVKHMENENEDVIKDKNDIVTDYINKFNEVRKTNYRVLPKTAISVFKETLKHYSVDEIITAYKNATKAQNHIDNGFQYLTPEFFTRINKIEMYINFKPKVLGQ